MKFLIAPNALKGSFSALHAADTIAQSLKEISANAECVLCPIADGGDGTVESLVRVTTGKFFTTTVRGPIAGMNVNARWGVLGDGVTAIIEMAEAVGLHLLKPNQYDVANATTFGVGELILTAMNVGYKKIIVGLGGSATNDGGGGCAQALGVQFFDEQNKELPGGGIHLSRLHHIQIKNDELRMKNVEFVGLSDVTNVLCGPEGAAFTFAAQKGATVEQVHQLDKAMKHYASIIERDLRLSVSDIPGSGAAGGLGAGLIAFCNARIVSGIDYVLDTVRFDELLQECDCVITAEGMIDEQTLRGKGIEGIARRAEKFNKPVHAFVGRIRGSPRFRESEAGDAAALQRQLGLTTLQQISPDGMPLEDSMRNAEAFLAGKIKEFFSTKNTKE